MVATHWIIATALLELYWGGEIKKRKTCTVCLIPECNISEDNS